MKLFFLSNYYTHHQKPTCEEWHKLTENSFTFVGTESFSDERKQMGWGEDAADFVREYTESLQPAIDAADAVILGSAPRSLVKTRLEANKTVFQYSERIFKKGYNHLKWLPRVYRFYKNYGRYKSLYLMAASGFTAADFAKHFTFIGKSYNWGYFPKTKRYDIQTLLEKKDTHRILWCGRMIDWKHPEMAISLAERLQKEKIPFQLDMIGNGEMDAVLQNAVEEKGLRDCVRFLGSMTPEKVREEMEKAGVYIFTSDFNEGWGAVLNEAMNSGCAVVASHAIGAVPFLLKHGENGLVYQNQSDDDLYGKVKALLTQPEKQKDLGESAYRAITELWNAELAAKRFLAMTEKIEKNGKCDLFDDGPCSRAPIIKNNWFKEADYDISWLKD